MDISNIVISSEQKHDNIIDASDTKKLIIG